MRATHAWTLPFAALLCAAWQGESLATRGQRAPYHPTQRLAFHPAVAGHARRGAPAMESASLGNVYNPPGFSRQSYEEGTWGNNWLGSNANIKDPYAGQGAQGLGAPYRGRGGR